MSPRGLARKVLEHVSAPSAGRPPIHVSCFHSLLFGSWFQNKPKTSSFQRLLLLVPMFFLFFFVFLMYYNCGRLSNFLQKIKPL